ncbi:MAG: tyrosine-type recombinase/integrase [Myxococcota bacterium]
MGGRGRGGLRPSELRRMRWDDVRFATRTLVVRGEKTHAAKAEIPLTPLAYRQLRTWWVRQGQPGQGFVFPADAHGAKGEAGHTSRSAYRRSQETAAKRAKIGRTVNMYRLRHAFATIAWSLGIEFDVARRIMRHTDEKMLRDVYCRPRPADLVARVAAFDLPAVGDE